MSDGRPSEWLNDLRSGDADSARRIFEHFSQRLCRVAQRHLSARVRPRVDEEDVVQSVFRTFFQRDAQGQFQVNHSDELYRLLEPIKERLLKRDSTLAGASNKDDASSNDGPLSGSDLS